MSERADDLLAIKRSGLTDMFRLALRVQGYITLGKDGVATGTVSVLVDELRWLADRKAMCQRCVSDAEENDDLCAYHQEVADAEIMELIARVPL